ncbi:MAG: hypothetical protein HUK23_07245, partial [Sphaerochaetaceae bacterium]|nr:hypothetical protein [Sphaerochaetaceae bacterium]
IYGLYNANINGNSVTFKDYTENPEVILTGSTSTSVDKEISTPYTISFDFRNYINDYGIGIYKGNITVEVVPV